MNLEVNFANTAQREFYYSTARNQCFSGGFNNGKTFGGILKALTLLTTFPNYRYLIARQTFSDLKSTTMQSFFKTCPPELIESQNWQDGLTTFKNKSMVFWKHLDKADEKSLRGFEPNSILIDQAEEIEEQVYDVLDGRVGRWDGAVVPESLKKQFPYWPKDQQGKDVAPSYIQLLCNPDTQFHFIFRKYHPDSMERRENYFFVEGEWDSSLGSKETYEEALKKGEEYVAKYVKGQWGLSNAQIHRLSSSSLLEPTDGLLDKIRKKGNLFRVLDHGDSSPTCCLWFAVLDGCYICYREYYVPNQVISFHRQSIYDLSGTERYSSNYADPQIFKKTAQKQGGFYSVADEYLSKDIEGPQLAWIPADNNEFATRNRINELLKVRADQKHPVTGEFGAPRIYFIKRTVDYQNGCFFAINELQSQRRELIGYVDGRAVYSDDRAKSIADHAYDPTRYFVAMHGSPLSVPKKQAKEHTFAWYQMMKKRKDQMLGAMSA